MSVSAVVLVLFISWTIVLLLVMEIMRGYLMLAGRVKSNEFRPDNANLSPFMQRLTRAHANCLEGLPVIGGVLLLALATGRADVTDALAPWLMVARVTQSLIHIASTSEMAVNARFAAFAVQIGIVIHWVWMLLAA